MIRYIVALLLFVIPLYADDSNEPVDTRKETLLYGIDSEVISLLDDLKDKKNTEFKQDIAKQYNSTPNRKLKQAILSYFEAVDENPLTEQVITELSEQEENEAFVLSLLEFVRTFKITDAAPFLDYYAQDRRPIIAASAVKTMGELGLEEKLQLLQELFEDGDTADSVQSEILLAFGKLKNEDIIPVLLDILDDTEEDRSNRWYACAALGELGGDEAFESIKNALQDSDTILRTYAISAIAKFEKPEVANILIQEGLRDSFWKVRLTSIEEIEKHGYTAAEDALIYKAQKDPEQKIRERSMQALGVLRGTAGLDYLVKVLVDEKAAATMRIQAARTLIQNDVGEISNELNTVLVNDWDKKNSRLIEYIAKELSVVQGPGLSALYEKLLTNEDLNIQIYAIRGIAKNGISSLKPNIEALNTEKAHPAIKKAVTDAIEQL